MRARPIPTSEVTAKVVIRFFLGAKKIYQDDDKRGEKDDDLRNQRKEIFKSDKVHGKR